MTRITSLASLVAAFALAIAPLPALADDVAHSTVGAGGYDVVSYFENEKPVAGNGNHLAVHEGVTYLFHDKANRKKFEKNPERYAPAYGGYCAYGASVGKKFHGDPTVWEIVDNRLYLNLDNKIKGIWIKDVPGNIRKADAQWERIAQVPADQL